MQGYHYKASHINAAAPMANGLVSERPAAAEAVVVVAAAAAVSVPLDFVPVPLELVPEPLFEPEELPVVPLPLELVPEPLVEPVVSPEVSAPSAEPVVSPPVPVLPVPWELVLALFVEPVVAPAVPVPLGCAVADDLREDDVGDGLGHTLSKLLYTNWSGAPVQAVAAPGLNLPSG